MKIAAAANKKATDSIVQKKNSLEQNPVLPSLCDDNSLNKIFCGEFNF